MDEATLWGAAAFLAVAILTIVLGKTTDLLRDSEPVDFGGAAPAGGGGYRRPYSLAQSQMAWWFCIVLGCFVFLCVTHGWQPNNILNQQSLILLGIGTGTAIGAAIIEQTKAGKLTTLDEFRKVLFAISALPAGDAALPALLARRDDLASRLASQDFLRDILTDADGISLHRFQAVAWTSVLGMIFILQVLENPSHALPEFDAVLLALLGISGGTYLGFKIPEQPA